MRLRHELLASGGPRGLPDVVCEQVGGKPWVSSDTLDSHARAPQLAFQKPEREVSPARVEQRPMSV